MHFKTGLRPLRFYVIYVVAIANNGPQYLYLLLSSSPGRIERYDVFFYIEKKVLLKIRRVR